MVLEACTVRRGQGSTTGRGKGGGGDIRNQLSQWAVTSSVVMILDTYFISDTDDDRTVYRPTVTAPVTGQLHLMPAP